MGQFSYKFPRGERHSIEVTRAQGVGLLFLVWTVASIVVAIPLYIFERIVGLGGIGYINTVPFGFLLSLWWFGGRK